MLEPKQIFDERATTNMLTEEMRSLYLFSFLLTADTDIAEQCYVLRAGRMRRGNQRFHGLDAFMGAPHDYQACNTYDQA